MQTVFVIRNQEGHYLTKKSEYWLDGSEPQYLFKTPHEDIALNTLIEYNSKQIDMRAEIVETEVSAPKNIPLVEISEIESKMPAKTTSIDTNEQLLETEESKQEID